MSWGILNKAFFNDLWSLILEENICDVHSKNTSKFFVPEKQLDKLWSHELLATKCYKEYQKPKELKLAYPEDETEPDPYEPSDRYPRVVIREPDFPPTLLEQHHAMHHRQLRSQKVSYDYVNRNFPWYMKKPIYQTPLVITEDLWAQFSNPFEMNILTNINVYQCKLLIIDVASEVVLGEMERWLKFCRYAKIVAVVRCVNMARRLNLFHGFQTVCVAENLEYTWQEELGRSLRAVTTFAHELDIFKNCAEPFIFIFSKNRYGCSWDTFKVLKKH